MIVCGIFAVIYSCLNLMGYRVEMDSKNVYISCGVLKKTSYSFEHSKINGVFLKRPLLARIFGLCSIEVAVVGFGNENKEVPQLCLLVNNIKAQEILNRCARDFLCEGQEQKSHKSAYLMAFIKVIVFMVLLVMGITVVLATDGTILNAAIYWIFALAFFVCTLFAGYMSCKTKSISFDGRILKYSKGIFSKQTSLFKYGDIQGTVVKTNPITHRLGSARMSFNILSGLKQRKHMTGYFETGIFEQIIKAVVGAEDTSSLRF